MNDRYVLIYILVSAAATLFMRALPFTILGKRKQIPEKIRYLGRILPAAIMAVLIVYCLKEVPTEFLSGGYKKLIAAAVLSGKPVKVGAILDGPNDYITKTLNTFDAPDRKSVV